MRKIITRTIVPVLLASTLSCSGGSMADKDNSKIRLGIAHCCVQSDTFLWNVGQNLQSSLKELGVQQVDFHNSEGSQSDQMAAVIRMLETSQALLVSFVVDDTIDQKHQREIIEAAAEKRVPVVFYSIKPRQDYMLKYRDTYYVGSQPDQSGIMQGEMVATKWLAHPEWDLNKDGVLQYAIIKGPEGNPDAEARTKWVKATIDSYPNLGIKGDLLMTLTSGTWNRAETIPLVGALMEEHPELEMIVSNNDEMALGAIDVAKMFGRKIPIFGIDGTQSGLAAVKSGDLAGTLLQNDISQGREAARLAINLAKGMRPDHELGEQLINHIVYTPYVPIDEKDVDKYIGGGSD